MDNDTLMSIGQFAAMTQLSQKALRMYDESGLLPAVHVDPVSGYRFYSEEQRPRALLISAMRRMGVPLKVVTDVVSLSGDDAVAAFHEWWVAEQRAFRARRGIAPYVTQLINGTGTDIMDVKTRSIPERKLAMISKELFQPELETFIMSSFTTLFDHLQSLGIRLDGTTPEEPTYVIFHGAVTPDQLARVDVCVVIDGHVEPTGEISIHLEPAHEEAYTELTKEGIEFPAILNAYGAVAAWVNQNGQMLESMPSREVYITDVLKAAPTDHVCDVAFPYEPR